MVSFTIFGVVLVISKPLPVYILAICLLTWSIVAILVSLALAFSLSYAIVVNGVKFIVLPCLLSMVDIAVSAKLTTGILFDVASSKYVPPVAFIVTISA